MATAGYAPVATDMDMERKSTLDRMSDGDVEIDSNDMVLQQSVPWEGMHTAQLISDVELRLMRAFDRSDAAKRLALMTGSDGAAYAEALLQLLLRLNHVDVLQYLLALVDEVLSADRAVVQVFLSLPAEDGAMPLRPFFRILGGVSFNAERAAHFIFTRALHAMATLMHAMRVIKDDDIDILMRWLIPQLRKRGDGDVLVAVSALHLLLRREEFRASFAEREGLRHLADVIRNRGQNLQLLYHSMVCLWLLAYSSTVRTQFAGERGLVRTIVETLRMEDALKVRRMCLSTLRNLVGVADAEEEMVDAGLVRLLAYLNERKWADPDMSDDIDVLTKRLDVVVESMSSWDRYKAEVLSGRLRWSPVHSMIDFWKQDAARLEDSNCRVLSHLLELLRTSSDTTVLAVACHDIGEYVSHRPRGRAVLSRLGGKSDIMALMQHGDAEVRKHALLALQKVMVQNWEALKMI